jgi:AcrR family transcriptional regulator
MSSALTIFLFSTALTRAKQTLRILRSCILYTDLTAPEQPQPRKLSREARRGQLIEATIDVLAEKGLSRFTLSDVAKKAGLSHGLVNFHFQSKELLLSETLSSLSEEYHANWRAALAEAGNQPARQLDALLRATVAPELATKAKLSAWVAFWGEAQSRPSYQVQCGLNDEAFETAMVAVCRDLMAEGGYAGDPVRVARALRLVAEGVWMDHVIMANPYDLSEGLASSYCTAAAFFPRHFNDKGLIV